MENITNVIYELIEDSPELAEKLALETLKKVHKQDQIDSINW